MNLWQITFITQEADHTKFPHSRWHHDVNMVSLFTDTDEGLNMNASLTEVYEKTRTQSRVNRKWSWAKKIISAVTFNIRAEGNHLPDSFCWLERQYNSM